MSAKLIFPCALVIKGLSTEIVDGCEIMLLHFMPLVLLPMSHRQQFENNYFRF